VRAALALGLASFASACVEATRESATHAEANEAPVGERVVLGPFDADLTGARRDEWIERETAIESELRTLGPHPWAGVYQRGGGYEIWTLKVAPRAGFTFRSSGCTAVTERNLGAVHEENGVLTLECAWPDARPDGANASRGFPERFTLVPWDDHVYLADDLGSFCSQVSAGYYPCALLREGKGRPSLATQPRVPPEFERCLRGEVLRARVIAVGAPEYPDDLELRGRRTRITLDVGRAEGAYLGLCLVTRGGGDTLPAHLDVIELDEHTAVAELVDHESPVRALPAVGAECATRWE